jgi:hypothetical protein
MGYAINIGGLVDYASIAAQGVGSVIIGHYKQNVRFFHQHHLV